MSDDDRLRDMALAVTEHGRPWTEDEYLALGETLDRVELVDGDLHMSPSPTRRHQRISRRLANVLEAAAPDFDVDVDVNIRLRHGRILIPDVVLSRHGNLDGLITEAATILLVCEVLSTNVGNDRVTKMHLYAEAGIPRYLIVDPAGPVLELYKLDGDKYVPEASARPGERLLLTEPVVAEIDPASLAQ
jgi:Uma2 family endonuclease